MSGVDGAFGIQGESDCETTRHHLEFVTVGGDPSYLEVVVRNKAGLSMRDDHSRGKKKPFSLLL